MEMLNSKSRYHPRVDLTAMVDLGFLLITFFMLASSMGIPKVLEINKPVGKEEQEIKESKTLTLILTSGEMAYSYVRDDQSAQGIQIGSFSFSHNGLRSKIIQRQQEVEQLYGDPQELYVLIKPLPNSFYKHLIDVLDEMRILQISRYTILPANTTLDSVAIKMIGG